MAGAVADQLPTVRTAVASKSRAVVLGNAIRKNLLVSPCRQNTSRHREPQPWLSRRLARRGLIGDDKEGNLRVACLFGTVNGSAGLCRAFVHPNTRANTHGPWAAAEENSNG